jgi:hypothetical protein
VLNLLSGAERQVRLLKDAGRPSQVGWAKDGRSLVVGTERGLYRTPAPPVEGEPQAVPPVERAAAESSLAVLLGAPPFARAVPCPEPADLCVVGEAGTPTLLAAGSHDAARWGPDSVAYFRGGDLVVRPLGPGRERRVTLRGGPAGPRQPTVFAGPPAR